jgi:hypothetical protein
MVNMSSFLGGIFNSLFGGSSSVDTNTLTAQDLLPKTEATTPTSAQMGDSAQLQQKKRGLSSLYANNSGASSKGSSGLNV